MFTKAIAACRILLLTAVIGGLLASMAPAGQAYAATLDGEEASLCRLVNEYRAQKGVAPLLMSSSLTADSKWHTGDMASKNYFNHVDSSGRDFAARMSAFGYTATTAKGENIAAGSATAAATIAQWKSSPPHNDNMLNPNYHVMGIGRAYGATAQYGWYWNNTFGGFNDGATPCPATATLAVNDVSVNEGNSGTTTATFTVTRAGDTSGTSSVRYNTADGTATAGSDYTALPLTTLTFAAGQATRTVAVSVNGDKAVEKAESFYLQLSSATGATIADASGTATIQNDDRTMGDYDGNGTTDMAVYRPSTGLWLRAGAAATTFGGAGDLPVPGDYDGNGTTDIAVFRPSTGQWFRSGAAAVSWGVAGDVPVPGDYDGNGTTDVAVFRPSTGQWLRPGAAAVTWGVADDVPVPGDYDGNGTTDVAVFRPSTGIWFRVGAAATSFGVTGDIPVPGDYDGNGTTDIAVLRPSTGQWFRSGAAIISWGVAGDVPVPGDYDGNGTADVAVFRPSTGQWLRPGQAPVVLGGVGDQALPLPGAIRRVYFP
jgi:uncharacterized protein YkwD